MFRGQLTAREWHFNTAMRVIAVARRRARHGDRAKGTTDMPTGPIHAVAGVIARAVDVRRWPSKEMMPRHNDRSDV